MGERTKYLIMRGKYKGQHCEIEHATSEGRVRVFGWRDTRRGSVRFSRYFTTCIGVDALAKLNEVDDE